MINFDRIKNMSVEEFVDEILLNVPDECDTRFIFGSWKNRQQIKQWLESEDDVMTPQEAIEIITNAIQSGNVTTEQDKALAMAQKALKGRYRKRLY